VVVTKLVGEGGLVSRGGVLQQQARHSTAQAGGGPLSCFGFIGVFWCRVDKEGVVVHGMWHK